MTEAQDQTSAPNVAAMIGAAMDWWRDAGVDCAFVDTPQDWLAAARAPVKPRTEIKAALEPAVPPPPRIGGESAQWPQALEDFATWWLETPDLPFPPDQRVAPAGPANAALMVLVPMPEETDSEQLLGGNAGALLDAILAALGMKRTDIYVASALPARVAMPDWATLGEQGLSAVLAHHVALAAPQRLLVLGKSVISTLLGHDLPNKADDLRAFNQEERSVTAVATYDLDAILAKPGLKAGLWNRLLDWTGTEPSVDPGSDPR